MLDLRLGYEENTEVLTPKMGFLRTDGQTNVACVRTPYRCNTVSGTHNQSDYVRY